MHFPLTDERRTRALELLEQLAGERPAILGAAQVGHDYAPVTRITLDREIEGAGATVIVKTRRVEHDGYGGPAHLKREQAGLLAVGDSEFTPRLLAADDDMGVVVMTDLGRGPTLESLLLGDDAERAEAAFVDLAATLGRLHAATAHSEPAYARALAELGVADGPTNRYTEWLPADCWAGVIAEAREFGLPDAAPAHADAGVVIDYISAPTPFDAIVHGDINPTNILVTPAGCRIVDFEGARFGHVGWDACCLHYPFPNYSAHWAVLPPVVLAAADRAYRDAIEAALPTEGYDEMQAIGAATAIIVRVRRLARIAEPDDDVNRRWRRRAQLVQQIGVFVDLAERAAILPDLMGWFVALRAAMTDRWTDATDPPPPVFPAFA
jgi:aminoglycoside phosphotransferase (APT) family kinase protein